MQEGHALPASITANEYELERDRRIARNLEILRNLGFTGNAPDGLQSKLSTFIRTAPAPTLKRVRPQTVVQAKDCVPTRISKRLKGGTPLSESEIMLATATELEDSSGGLKGTGRRGLKLDVEGSPVHPSFTLRSIGTTIWELGDIYRGPWAQRYWSNPGCLYHHAYPVGYRASKTHFGRTYQMSIEAGPQGPVFKVKEEGSGMVFKGSSPTKPWTDVCISLKTGQRISGPLFFGFSDPITMRAIAALYTPEELVAAQQGERVENKRKTDAERAAKEFASVDGIGEVVAMVLAVTTSLGGAPHASLGSLKAWAVQAGNADRLEAFLLESKELPAGTLRWPAWRKRLVPNILRELCGTSTAEEPEDLPKTGESESSEHGPQGNLRRSVMETMRQEERRVAAKPTPKLPGAVRRKISKNDLGAPCTSRIGTEGTGGSGRARRPNSRLSGFHLN